MYIYHVVLIYKDNPFYLTKPSKLVFSQWCPDKSSVFGSSAEDGILNIWDYEKVLPFILILKFHMS